MNGHAVCRIREMNSGRNTGEFMDNVRIIRSAWRQWWCATDVRPLFGDQWPLCGYGRQCARIGCVSVVGVFRPSERPKNTPERTEKDRPAPCLRGGRRPHSGTEADGFLRRFFPAECGLTGTRNRCTRPGRPAKGWRSGDWQGGLVRSGTPGGRQGVRAPCAGPRASWPRSCRHGRG